jgi:2,3-bisphosphoglycerate-dependent phosphoglycerate mutase
MDFITRCRTHDLSTGLKIYFIRHAESLTNSLPKHPNFDFEDSASIYDSGLSPLGCQQAENLADYLSKFEVVPQLHESNAKIVYCSAMHRTLLTSQCLQRALGVNPTIWVDLHEVHPCGKEKNATKGMTRTEIESKFPGFGIPENVTEQGWFLNEQPETEEEAWQRADRVWERLRCMSEMDVYQGKSIIIVTHGLFLDSLFRKMGNGDIKSGNFYLEPRYIFHNTGISMVWVKNQKAFIYSINRIEHLAVMSLVNHHNFSFQTP